MRLEGSAPRLESPTMVAKVGKSRPEAPVELKAEFEVFPAMSMCKKTNRIKE